MSYKEFEDEADQRIVARNIKVTIRPRRKVVNLTKNACNCKCGGNCKCGTVNDPAKLLAKFEKLQKELNPKKDCKDAFHEAYTYLIASGGMISKVMLKGVNKPFGYLIRIPSITNSKVVFLNFFKAENTNNNSYFQKLAAIISTIIKGERWLKNREESGDWYIDDIPFELRFNATDTFMHIDDGGVNVIKSDKKLYYMPGRILNDVEREGYLIDEEIMDYIKKFEQKARDYYKENGKNKKFIALHVS